MATGNKMQDNEVIYHGLSTKISLTESDFGTLAGDPVRKFTWRTESGFSVAVISYGAIIQSIKVPDKHGFLSDVVLGFDELAGYVTQNTPDLLGGVVGRCAGRVAGASFELDGAVHQLTRNCGQHHLHGGVCGFDKVNWKSTTDGTAVVFSYLSKDGEQGYPGDLITNVSYEVKDGDILHIEYTAMTNMKTVVNLTNHSYFNLAGHETGEAGLREHTVVVNSDRILEGDSEWVPTGCFVRVGGTPFDLRTATSLDDVISNTHSLRFHHNFVVTSNGNKDLNFVSRVEHPPSGRSMEVYSHQPSVIFYTGNYIQSQGHPVMVGKGGVTYGRCGGLCLETMNLVDAINHQKFPSPVLNPGHVYKHRAVFRFGVVKE